MIERQKEIIVAFFFPIIHGRSLYPKEKNFRRAKLTHRRSMFDEWRLFQGLLSENRTLKKTIIETIKPIKTRKLEEIFAKALV